MAPTPVTTRHNPEQTRVEAVLDSGHVPGFSEYDTPAEGVYRFFHTEVDDEYGGQGVAKQIAAGAIDVARTEGVKVLPKCSFIRRHMREHEDTHDLLAPGATLEPDPEDADG